MNAMATMRRTMVPSCPTFYFLSSTFLRKVDSGRRPRNIGECTLQEFWYDQYSDCLSRVRVPQPFGVLFQSPRLAMTPKFPSAPAKGSGERKRSDPRA